MFSFDKFFKKVMERQQTEQEIKIKQEIIEKENIVSKLKELEDKLFVRIARALKEFNFEVDLSLDRTVRQTFNFNEDSAPRSYESAFVLMRRINARLIIDFGPNNFSFNMRIGNYREDHSFLQVFISEKPIPNKNKYVVAKMDHQEILKSHTAREGTIPDQYETLELGQLKNYTTKNIIAL